MPCSLTPTMWVVMRREKSDRRHFKRMRFPPFDDEEPAGEGRMTFLEHLDELRKRITHAVLALLVGFLVAFAFANKVFDFVYAHLTKNIPGGKFIYTDPGEGFFLWIKVSLLTGILISSPYIMWQVWLFIAPGLYAKEKRFAIPFVVSSSSLFILGAAFSHYVVFPLTWRFFVSFTTDILTFAPRIEPAFEVLTKAGVSFEFHASSAHRAPDRTAELVKSALFSVTKFCIAWLDRVMALDVPSSSAAPARASASAPPAWCWEGLRRCRGV